MGSNASNLAQAAAQQAASLAAQIYYAYGYTQNNGLPSLGTSGPWRPPQWSSKNKPLFSILPVVQGSTTEQPLYVFDGPMEISHEQQSVITLNPIQTGAPIADHAYVVPARVTARLMMSDSMQSYTVGQFAGGAGRSVSAWQILKSLQASKTFLHIHTRLDDYDNMLISSTSAVEDKDTRFAGKFTVTFTQVLMALVASTDSGVTFPGDTTRPETTVETPVGQTNGQALLPGIDSYIVEPGITSPVPAAGTFSSIPYYGGTFPGMGSRIP